jgi:hypothetical protein
MEFVCAECNEGKYAIRLSGRLNLVIKEHEEITRILAKEEVKKIVTGAEVEARRIVTEAETEALKKTTEDLK